MTTRLTREQWGALDPKRPLTSMATAKGCTVHYEGPRMGAYAHSRCAGIVRAIQRSHMANVKQGWKDVAYNELACRHGVRYEGRGYRNEPGANGTSAANRGSYAICALIGEGDEVTPELKAALRDAIDDYRARGAGNALYGHRDHVATKCPGNALYAWVKAGAPGGHLGGGHTAPIGGNTRTLVPYPGHQHGDSTKDDHHVEQIQKRLRQLRIYKGAIDEHYGPQTVAAVRAFQRANRLDIDGWVGRSTWAALRIYNR